MTAPQPPVVDPFAPVQLGPVTLRNRFVKAATFEGVTQDHRVNDRLIEFHRTMARGGVGMTTVAYCSVTRDGCGTPNELILTRELVPGLRRLADAVHAEGAAVAAQIGHAGAVAASTGHKGISPSPIFSPLAMRRTRAATRDDIVRIVRAFGNAARVVADGGFDAVEVHLGHGYLPSEFLSPRLNKRGDDWGGSLENRAKLAREVVRVVRDAVDDRLAVTAKLNMADGVRGGLWLDESIEVGRMLESDGCLDALELTAGSSLQNPMYLFRGDAPVVEMSRTMPKAIRPAFRLFGGRFLRSYPFHEAYLLPYARQFRDALSMPLILLGGINRIETVHQALAEGFEFVALGRALLREPDLLERWRAGRANESLCVHCNKCMATIYRGTHCVLVAEDDQPWVRSPRTQDVTVPN
jgi:2,4-dienoyl-CoA reductase-like NADH-dependent reductase (Old Yellow Enzyme family)